MVLDRRHHRQHGGKTWAMARCHRRLAAFVSAHLVTLAGPSGTSWLTIHAISSPLHQISSPARQTDPASGLTCVINCSQGLLRDRANWRRSLIHKRSTKLTDIHRRAGHHEQKSNSYISPRTSPHLALNIYSRTTPSSRCDQDRECPLPKTSAQHTTSAKKKRHIQQL